ncbi:MAG TPA: OmpH family outer membrane protein, partial [Saprospiraceae bacterium]|nr:OmpH family outer membrane protein [Saprospiraceae bacterium]
KYSQEAASGEITPKKNKERELELQKERDDLGALEQKLLQKIQEKRQAVYEPIFEKVDKAVKEVGKENNYTIIFNESTGVLLFNIKSDDVSPLVKAKLGM